MTTSQELPEDVEIDRLEYFELEQGKNGLVCKTKKQWNKELQNAKAEERKKWRKGIEKWTAMMFESKQVKIMGDGKDDVGWYDESELEASILSYVEALEPTEEKT